jgi:integrase
MTSLADLHRARRRVPALARHPGQPTDRRPVGHQLPAKRHHPDHSVRDRDRRLGLGRRPGTGAVHPRRHPEDPQATAPVHPRPRARQAHDSARAVAQPQSAGGGIVARWSGARRDEIRRLAVDCLDTYPDGHPRLRIPVGKGYTERSIPLHPQAADALQPLIELARRQGGRRRYDPSAGREVQPIFVVRGKLRSKSLLFDMALAKACTAAGLVDSAGKATITAHRFRHTIGTQLAEGGACIQTIMAALGHRTPNMSIIYASLSDPTVKQQYQDAMDRHLGPDVTLAGPAADALREHRLDPEAVSWLQTNFLKTELELGHCLRTPAEGPCECDLVLTCSKFLTTSDYPTRLRARLESRSSSSRTPPPAAGHARSNGTKQPNDAWSGSSTTWPEANLALDSGRSWSTVLGQSPAERRWGGTRDRSTCVPGGLLVRWSSDRTCRGHVTAPGLSRPGSGGGSVDWLRGCRGAGRLVFGVRPVLARRCWL